MLVDSAEGPLDDQTRTVGAVLGQLLGQALRGDVVEEGRQRVGAVVVLVARPGRHGAEGSGEAVAGGHVDEHEPGSWNGQDDAGRRQGAPPGFGQTGGDEAEAAADELVAGHRPHGGGAVPRVAGGRQVDRSCAQCGAGLGVECRRAAVGGGQGLVDHEQGVVVLALGGYERDAGQQLGEMIIAMTDDGHRRDGAQQHRPGDDGGSLRRVSAGHAPTVSTGVSGAGRVQGAVDGCGPRRVPRLSRAGRCGHRSGPYRHGGLHLTGRGSVGRASVGAHAAPG